MKSQSIIFVLALTFILGITANAATWTVTKSTNSNDGVCSADCSLREAVAVANFDDTVVFNPNLIGQTFTLGGNNIEITKRITIDGNLDGVNVVFLSGNNTSRHFLIRSSGSLNLKNMILTQGNGTGSGIINGGGSIEAEDVSGLRLDRVSIRGNSSAGTGGAIKLNGIANNPIIINSSITGNTARSAPAIYNEVNLHISNTTISNNRVINPDANGWGAIANFGNLYLRNCTVVDNQAKNGGGIVAIGGFSPGRGSDIFTDLGNSIVAENTATDSGQDILFFSNVVSVGGNLIGNTNTVPGGVFVQTNDAVNLNPLVAPTNANQGGHPISTHPLQAGSPALNTGINSVAVEHQFGTPLPNDARGAAFPRISGGTVDKGAFEDQTNGASLIVTKLADGNDNVCDTDCSLREAVFAASQNSGTENIMMAANVFGTMPLQSSMGEIVIQNQSVNVIGYPTISAATLVVSGGNTNRLFRLSNANVAFTGLTMANGNGNGGSPTSGGGALLAVGGTLTLDRVIIRNNSNGGIGGGFSVFGGRQVRVMNSTINNNSASQAFAVYLDSLASYLTNTTITNNSSSSNPSFGAINVRGAFFMRNSTVADNRAGSSSDGAGLDCLNASVCSIGNSILANNLGGIGADLHADHSLTSVGGNLVENTTGYDNPKLTQTNDQIGVDPLLMPLGNNGGNVPTMMLNPASPAINTGINPNATDPSSATALTTDARGAGYMRIVSIVDKGAFETLVPTAAAVSISGRISVGKSGLTNAAVYIIDQQGNVRSTVTGSFGNYRIENLPAGQTYIITVVSKKYQFNSQIITATQDVAQLDFEAQMM